MTTSFHNVRPRKTPNILSFPSYFAISSILLLLHHHLHRTHLRTRHHHHRCILRYTLHSSDLVEDTTEDDAASAPVEVEEDVVDSFSPLLELSMLS